MDGTCGEVLTHICVRPFAGWVRVGWEENEGRPQASEILESQNFIFYASLTGHHENIFIKTRRQSALFKSLIA